MAAERRRSGDRHKGTRPDRHKGKQQNWRPDPVVYPLALDAAKEIGSNLTAYLNESMRYLIGQRKDPPPRPDWAEQQAAELPDE